MGFFTGLAKGAGASCGALAGLYMGSTMTGLNFEGVAEKLMKGKRPTTGNNTQIAAMVGGTVVGGIAGYYATDAIINALASGNAAPMMSIAAAPLAAMPSVV
jgi:hypothetical protein